MRRAFRYLQVGRGSSAFAVGMLRYFYKKKQVLPTIPERVRPLLFIQQRGETVYIPAGYVPFGMFPETFHGTFHGMIHRWHHAVLSLDDSIGITQNFAERENAGIVMGACSPAIQRELRNLTECSSTT